MFNYDIKFLTFDDSLYIKNGDFKTYKYETKKRLDESVYDVGKRSYCERRGGQWRAPKPRQIKQLESKIIDRGIVASEWTNESLLTLVFGSGAIAYLSVRPDTLDVTKILFDRYCVGKLAGPLVTGVVLSKTHLLFTHVDRLATLISLGKNHSASSPCRIRDREPFIQTVELGGAARRTERRVTWSDTSTGVRVLVWSVNNAEPAPWSPLLEDHANLHLYQIQGHQISLLAYHQLENETLSAELSQKRDNLVHIVEQIACHKNGVILEWLRYDIPNSERVMKFASIRGNATRVSLSAPARVVRRSPCDTKLLVASIDGSISVLHHLAGHTHSTKAGFIATDVRWSGELVIAAEEGGRLQCFDRALSLLHLHTKCLDLTTNLRDSRRMQLLATRTARAGPIMVIAFAGGPLALLRIAHPKLLTAWIRSGRSSNAVSLLRALDWELEGPECLWAANRLVCEALRSGPEGESIAQAALGAYLAPVAPHSSLAERFSPPVHDLARKFFHHLLRRGRMEKAMSLAVDLGAWDLFADARWAATRQGLPHLAEEAAALARSLPYSRTHSECSESCSRCSSRSVTDDESASSGQPESEPPPLPRLSMPSLLSVPISPTTLLNTTSIRPNLHQYLERDSTIWTTRVEHGNHDHSYEAGPSKSEIPRLDGRVLSSDFRHVFRTELREDSSPMYRYRYPPNNEKVFRNDDQRNVKSGEKNKVKFSDTVTIAVMSEPSSTADATARELAESLPLCPPHKYLSAFNPHPHALPLPGTTLDYVEV